MSLVNTTLKILFSKQISKIEYFKKNPVEVQENTLTALLNQAKDTEFGKYYDFKNIKSSEKFSEKVPIFEYDDLKPYIERTINGEQNILWNTEIHWFAKSSGTTSDRSKFIPISKECLYDCHFRSGRDIYALYVDIFPDTKIFLGKALSIGGSTSINKYNKNSYTGDLSSIITKNLPFWTNQSRVPNNKIGLIPEWDIKLNQILLSTINQNVTQLIGVPSWLLVLLNNILEHTNKSNILEVWQNLELFIHGGISFIPYKSRYEQIIPTTAMTYIETYNASEGFFGIQDEFYLNNPDLLLMLDYGIYYEFIELENYTAKNMKTIPLSQVKTGISYAIIITTNSGLWRYIIGDTIVFTNTNPYRFRIVGRTKHYINAFGEELVVENAQNAISYACEQTNAQIREYTAAPFFYDRAKSQGTHEWLFEFTKEPDDIKHFVELLDEKLRLLNSDYDAKRFKDINLGFPKYTVLKTGVFHQWLKQKGKLGGQSKVPNLSNSRNYVDEILKLNDEKTF